MALRRMVIGKIRDWGDRLDQAAGAPPKHVSNEEASRRELGRIMTSPGVVERLDTEIRFQEIAAEAGGIAVNPPQPE